MTAFFIATINVKDSEKFQQYAAKAAQTFIAFKGELVLRGKSNETLAGTADDHATGIVRFPDMATLNNWYESPEYQALIPLRDAGADMKLVSYNVPE